MRARTSLLARPEPRPGLALSPPDPLVKSSLKSISSTLSQLLSGPRLLPAPGICIMGAGISLSTRAACASREVSASCADARRRERAWASLLLLARLKRGSAPHALDALTHEEGLGGPFHIPLTRTPPTDAAVVSRHP